MLKFSKLYEHFLVSGYDWKYNSLNCHGRFRSKHVQMGQFVLWKCKFKHILTFSPSIVQNLQYINNTCFGEAPCQDLVMYSRNFSFSNTCKMVSINTAMAVNSLPGYGIEILMNACFLPNIQNVPVNA